MSLPHHSAGDWLSASLSAPAQLGAAAVAGSASLFAWVTAETPDLASHAITLGGSAIVMGILSLIGKAISDGIAAWMAVLKNRDDNDVKVRLAKIEADRAAEKERREAERELTSAQLLAQQVRSESQDAKLKGLKQGQRANGLAIETIGKSVGVAVEPSVPPEGSGDHPTIP